MKNKLVIGLLGHRNSGKSSTWNDLFQRTVKTGTEIRRLYLTKSKYIEVFLVSGSPEERDTYVGELIGKLKPRIVLCSMQYIPEVSKTIDFFVENDYFLYIQWLNPGYNDQNDIPHSDYLGIANQLVALDSTISIRDAKQIRKGRVQEIKDYLYGWAFSRDLLIEDRD